MIRAFILSLLVFSCSLAEAKTVQVKALGDLAISTTTDVYFSIEGTNSNDTPVTDRQGIAASAGTAIRMRVCLSVAPQNGAGTQSVTLALQVAGTTSSTTVTISEDDTCAETDTQSTYVAGDRLNYIQSAANTPAAANINAWIWLVDGTNNETLYFASSGGSTLSTSATQYLPIVQNNALNTTENNVQIPMPFAGTLKGFYADLTTAPDNGAGTQTRGFTVMIDGSASTSTCNISESATTCNDTTNQPTFTAGQTLTFRSAIVAGTPAASTAHFGIVVQNTVGGFALLSTNATNMSATVTEYHRMYGNPAWVTTESSRFQYYSNLQLKAIYAKQNGSSNNGAGTQSYTYTQMDDGVNGNCSCAISEAATTCNDTCTDNVALGSRLAYEKVPANTPTARIVGLGTWAHLRPRRIF